MDLSVSQAEPTGLEIELIVPLVMGLDTTGQSVELIVVVMAVTELGTGMKGQRLGATCVLDSGQSAMLSWCIQDSNMELGLAWGGKKGGPW